MEILQDFPDYKAPRMYPHRGLTFHPSNISYIPLPGLFYHTSKVLPQSDGSYTIESAAFPNVFLRMDGNNPSRKEEDFGTVNCQYGAGAYEKFYLQNMPEIKNVKDMFNKITK